MFELDKKGGFIRSADDSFKPKTSHTLNPVPLHVFAPGYDLSMDPGQAGAGLANVAATSLHLMGYRPPADYLPSVLSD
jgi:2,3-bisphosphoglycerate-independent phosphoglycerate mutase